MIKTVRIENLLKSFNRNLLEYSFSDNSKSTEYGKCYIVLLRNCRGRYFSVLYYTLELKVLDKCFCPGVNYYVPTESETIRCYQRGEPGQTVSLIKENAYRYQEIYP